MNSKKGLSLYTAIAVVVANMIGTGVFTSLGYQVLGIQSVPALLLLWAVGGVIALCGALCYAELASRFPRSGGEYHYLSKIYHPSLGFLSGWASVTVGFAAPVALAAMALGTYLTAAYPWLNAKYVALGVVGAVTIIHSIDVNAGGAFQRVFTGIKVIFLLFFIVAAYFAPVVQPISIIPGNDFQGAVLSAAFAVNLIYVSYAYSGWNAAAYMAGEIREPQKNVPKALLIGTAIVAAIYVLINYAFLRVEPISELAARQAADMGNPLEVAYLAAIRIFGETGGRIMNGMIALLLVSTLSSMIFAGPRISQVMGEDLPGLRFLAKKTVRGVPFRAILLQTAITVSLILASYFNQVLRSVGFTLTLFTVITVIGMVWLRIKEGKSQLNFRSPLFPIPALIFIVLNAWTLWYVANDNYKDALIGLGIVLSGIIIYFATRSKRTTT